MSRVQLRDGTAGANLGTASNILWSVLVCGVRATNPNEHDELVGRPRHPSRAISITLLSPPPVNKVPGGGWNQQCCYNCLWDGDVRGYETSAMFSLLLARTSSDLTYILIKNGQHHKDLMMTCLEQMQLKAHRRLSAMKKQFTLSRYILFDLLD